MNLTSLAHVLEKTTSADNNELINAQQYLEHALQTNPPEFIKALSNVLANPSNSPIARTAAGLQIKNTLTSKDDKVKEHCQQRWLSFPEDVRHYTKENVLRSIGTETTRPSSAAQCIAFIAIIELPFGSWQELINILCTNVISDTSTELIKEASLEAIGYICQDIDRDCLIPHSNNILTAIIHGMRKEITNQHVRRAATTALLNSLEFTKANFDKEMERNYIMEVICETTQSPDTHVRAVALECLVKIMTLYYQYMEPYMAQALFPITLEAMKSKIDNIALQGIEFWTNVSDEESDLAIEGAEAAESGEPPRRTSRFYAKGALQYVIPILLQKLTQQEEFDDEDEWNPCKAASTCLMSLANCCEEDILPYIIPFVKENIKNADWRYRDAAIMAFGAILGGMKEATLHQLVETALPTIIKLMCDPSLVVRDTAAWTIGRICEISPDSAINDAHLENLLKTMVMGLKSEPRIASNVCWAFNGLSEASYEAASSQENTDQPSTYCLSKYFDSLVEKLLETTNRIDGSQANLRLAAYEALMEMIKNSPRDCYATVQRMTLVILERLNTVLALEGQLQNNNDRAQITDLQGLLCATLQNVLKKVTPEDAPKISDQIMTALLHMFSSYSGENGGVQEDAMMAVTTLVQILGEGFIKYMESFKPFLFAALKNHAEYQVCLAAVGVVGDLCRELKISILPYCDEIMTQLLQNLSDTSVHRLVKPQIISLFGDLALAIGPAYEKYMDVVLTMLVQAAKIQVDRNDFDMVDYLNELRESICDAYTGMVQGLPGNNLLEQHLIFILEFINTIGTDDDTSDSTLCTCVGLIGDLCGTFGMKLLPLMKVDVMNAIIQKARRSRINKTKSHGQWAAKELRKLTRPVSW